MPKWLTGELALCVGLFTLAFMGIHPVVTAIGYVGGFVLLYRYIDSQRNYPTARKW